MKQGRKIRKAVFGVLMAALMLLAFVPAVGAEPSVWYTSIFVKTYPKKMTYIVGDSFDSTGMVICGNVQYANGGTGVNTLGDSLWTCSPKTLSTAGEQTITVTAKIIAKSGSYEQFKTTFKVTVLEKFSTKPIGDGPTSWTNSIAVKKQPTKTEYMVGEQFDPAGMTVIANNIVDGKKAKETIPKVYLSYTPKKFTKTGKQKVTVKATLTDSEGHDKEFSTTVSVVVYDSIVITKNPTKETVKEGGSCLFIARADNAKECHWYFEKDSVKVDAKKAESFFKGLKLSGATSEKLKLSKIPASMDGWRAYCTFSTPFEDVNSKKALLTVQETESKATEQPTEKPEEQPTEKPTEKPTAAPTEKPTEAPIVSPVEQPTERPTAEPSHVHSFGTEYKSDNTSHWHECSCGERRDEEAHIVTEWRTLTAATADSEGVEIGKCLVCGRLVERSVAAQASSLKLIVLAAAVAVALLIVPPILVVAIVLMTKDRKKRNLQ